MAPNVSSLTCIVTTLSLLLSACIGVGGNGSTQPLDNDSNLPSLTPDTVQDSYAPQISLSSQNQAVAVWQQNDPNRLALYASITLSDTTWSATQLIDGNNDQDAALMRTAINASGKIIATWVQWDGVNYNIWANIYSPGIGWQNAQIIETNDSGNALYPEVAINASGDAIVVWSLTVNKENSSHIMSRRYSDDSWANEEKLSTGSIYPSMPKVALNDNGIGLAIWPQLSNGWVSIYSSTLSDNWSAPQLIETDNSGHASNVQLALSNEGIAHAVWSQSDGTYSHIWSNHYSPESQWGTAQRIEKTTDANSRYPQIAMDATGKAIALWQQPNEKKESIWANRYTPTESWGEAVLIETNDASPAYSPQIAFTASGSAIAAWSQKAVDSNDAKIWINRYNDATSTWGKEEIVQHANNCNAANPQLANRHNTQTLIAWEFTHIEKKNTETDAIAEANTCDNTTGSNEINALNRIHIGWLP